MLLKTLPIADTHRRYYEDLVLSLIDLSGLLLAPAAELCSSLLTCLILSGILGLMRSGSIIQFCLENVKKAPRPRI